MEEEEKEEEEVAATMTIAREEKRSYQGGRSKRETKIAMAAMVEELDLLVTLGETMTKGLATTTNKEEMKKTEITLDMTEDTIATRKTEETGVEAEIAEIEETEVGRTSMATAGQDLDGAARRLQASGSFLQATPWPPSLEDCN